MQKKLTGISLWSANSLQTVSGGAGQNVSSLTAEILNLFV